MKWLLKLISGNEEKKFEVFDRVSTKIGEPPKLYKGTVIKINDSKPPDIDIIVLFDESIHGRRVVEAHIPELEILDEKATEAQTNEAEYARKELEKALEKYEGELQKHIEEDLSQSSKKVDKIIDKIESESTLKKAQNDVNISIENLCISDNAKVKIKPSTGDKLEKPKEEEIVPEVSPQTVTEIIPNIELLASLETYQNLVKDVYIKLSSLKQLGLNSKEAYTIIQDDVYFSTYFKDNPEFIDKVIQSEWNRLEKVASLSSVEIRDGKPYYNNISLEKSDISTVIKTYTDIDLSSKEKVAVIKDAVNEKLLQKLNGSSENCHIEYDDAYFNDIIKEAAEPPTPPTPAEEKPKEEEPEKKVVEPSTAPGGEKPKATRAREIRFDPRGKKWVVTVKEKRTQEFRNEQAAYEYLKKASLDVDEIVSKLIDSKKISIEAFINEVVDRLDGEDEIDDYLMRSTVEEVGLEKIGNELERISKEASSELPEYTNLKERYTNSLLEYIEERVWNEL